MPDYPTSTLIEGETCVVDFADVLQVTRSLEVPLANRRKIENVIEEQLNGLFQNLNIHDE